MLVVHSDNHGLEFSLYVDPLRVYQLTGGQQEFNFECFRTGIPSLVCIASENKLIRKSDITER
jgi:hypothetical protein